MLSVQDATVFVAAIGAVGGIGAAAATAWAAVKVEEVKRGQQVITNKQDDLVASVEGVQSTALEAKSAADTAVKQTVATGNGHAGRVEGGLAEVLDRLGRIEQAADDAKVEARETRRELKRDLQEVRTELSVARTDITKHLQDHASAHVRREDS